MKNERLQKLSWNKLQPVVERMEQERRYGAWNTVGKSFKEILNMVACALLVSFPAYVLDLLTPSG